MRVRTLLIDDEEPARHRLRALLEELDGIEVVGEARDGEEALRRIAELRPDLLFLDIDMPGLSGMEVAARLAPPRPRIIFCTAYDRYAVEAFEQHATDYLLKPVNRRRLGQAVERVRKARAEQEGLRREVADAGRAQSRLYPQRLAPMRRLDYAGLCRPAGEVGGDYYDFLSLGEGRLGLAVGDVSGKGIFAGLLMANLQARVQSLAPLHGVAVDRLAAELNRLMHSSTDSNRYATLLYGLFDDAEGSLTWVNAGNPPGMLLHRGAGGEGGGLLERRLEPSGAAIGLLAEATYSPGVVRLRPGDLLCLFTDGVVEATDAAGEEFGPRRLRALLAGHAGLPAARLCATILDEVERFSNAHPPQDDRTVIVGRVW